MHISKSNLIKIVYDAAWGTYPDPATEETLK